MHEITMPPTSKGLDWPDIGVITTIVAAIVGAAVFIVIRIFKLGKVAQRLQEVEAGIKEVKGDVKKSNKDLTTRIDDLMKMLAQKGLAAADSPRQLTPKGIKVVKNSGIDSIVEDRFDYIVRKVQDRKPSNPYQAEKAVLEVVEELVNDPALKDAIEEGAFNSGYFLQSVLFAGGIYIRDKVLSELGYKVEEIDAHNPKVKQKK